MEVQPPVVPVLAPGVHSLVLVEGRSDLAALEALAVRRGRDLAAEGVVVVSVGGATSIGRFLDHFGPAGLDLTLAGVCDLGEVGAYRRALERAGVGSDLEELGFHVCTVDLEDELIRALGAPAVTEVIDAAGELRSFRTLQQQPAQRDRPIEAQLHRFMGSKGGRKVRYARLLVDALDLAAVPRPL
ncbi:MAG TPA: TOPRIM nucleotidyl transferase/hydrolase domain-containing protein, partial [Acidimicrobiales bacterium]